MNPNNFKAEKTHINRLKVNLTGLDTTAPLINNDQKEMVPHPNAKLFEHVFRGKKTSFIMEN